MSRLHQERLHRFSEAGLYVVISGPELSLGRSFDDTLELVLAGGARLVQLRGKDLSKRELFGVARSFRQRTLEQGCLLVIDDELDVALAAGADGVHLGQDDLPLAEARRLAPDLLIGASSHSLDEALVARRDGASYVNVGPVFPTTTKGGLPRFLGVDEARSVVRALNGFPTSTMGGVKRDNLQDVKSIGSTVVALVTAVTAVPDPAAETAWFLRNLGVS